MNFRSLGTSGLRVSEVGFGAWGIGGGWGQQDDQAAIASLQTAFDEGINFFDSAYAYGDGYSEKLIGQALGSQRDEIVIASKIPPKNFTWPTQETDRIADIFPAEWIISCTERTLKNLGTDVLDLQQLHAWSDSFLEQPEWLDTLNKLKEQGKIRALGVSANDWEPYNTERLAASGQVDSIQVIYNLFEQRPAEKLFPAAQAAQTGIIARVPFEEGLLTGRFRSGHTFDENDWRKDWMTPERLKEVEPRLQALEAELDDNISGLPELALTFILAHPAVSTVIPGMRTRKHVHANAAVSSSTPLSNEKAERLTRHAFNHGWDYPWSA